MRVPRAWLLYLLMVFVGGALLAPALYWLAQGLAFEWPVWERVAANPFHRFVHRSLEILAEHENERTGVSEGFTPNYLKVFFEYPRDVQGCIIPFKLTGLFQDGFRGILGEPGREYGRAF